MTLLDTARPGVSELTPVRRRLALLAIALGGFGIGGSEFVSMGLLPGIAHGLLPELMASDPESGIARAGIAITAYALGVVVGAPALALLSVRWSRTTMIMLLAVALAAGTLSFVAEYNPLFGDQAMEAVNTVLDGGTVEPYIQIESTTFDSPEAAEEALPDRKY